MVWLAVPLAVIAAGTTPSPLPPDWAYKPATTPAVPDTRDATAVRTPVDAFLLAKLEQKKLSFAPAADRHTLIRRVTFDLTGLPPTPAEVDAFVNDAAPDAYEKLVDRLLASPHFGERAAIWWLDLARYADSDGFKADDTRPNAWRYRDYVIRSFNADKPYDRFVKEQLAGDELEPGSADALVATGFLRHFPYEYNAVDVELKRQEILNDITDTTAAAFLGVTFGCAKCHDHKTDPISQRDYYRLQAFFAGFRPTDLPLLKPGELAELERKQAEWEAKTADLRRQMAELEKPIRDRASARERKRFPDEYAHLLDMPPESRSPLQVQLALMVEKQVYSRTKFNPSQMKGAEKSKWEGMAKRMAEYEKEKPTDPPEAMAMVEVGPLCPPTHLLKRGNWRNHGEELTPGFPSAIDDRDAEYSPGKSTSGRRSALASWIADAKNPLTARVMVNRIWQQMFGRGIVTSPSDLGLTGDRPSHPELLDWLAHEFATPTADKGSASLRGGAAPVPWSVKRVYRLIASSNAYRQAARGSDAGLKADPENTLLWQMPRKRLDGESLRDAMLTVAGILNEKAGGPGVFPELPAELKANSWKVSTEPAERNRRSVYVFVKRNLRYPFFTLFDSPDRTETCARRFVTTTAPQALTLLNDQIVVGFAKTFAARVTKEAGADPEKVIDRAFRLALGRPPTSEERETVRAFFSQRGGLTADSVADFCHSVLNVNEFLYVD